MRLRITYSQKLRNLVEEPIAESARTDCRIVDESLLVKTLSKDEGKNVNYKCESNVQQEMQAMLITL